MLKEIKDNYREAGVDGDYTGHITLLKLDVIEGGSRNYIWVPPARPSNILKEDKNVTDL
jgi:hypothetical protein